MCGIGAIITRPGQAISSRYVKRMMALMRHRGPDDEGYLCVSETGIITCRGPDSPEEIHTLTFPQIPEGDIRDIDDVCSVLLGHRRLSIVDLSVAGHQPLCSEDRRYWIVYNGEVYNFRDIRDELVSLGYSFYSDSDTEVILKSYISWGADCLHRFNGMWSFVIYDAVRGEFFCARDRFGVKPFYYWLSDDGFLAISSEIKGFTVLPGWKAVVNPNRAYDFLVNGLLDHTSETLFYSVFQLMGGQYLRFTNENLGNMVPVSWYNPAVHSLQDHTTSLVCRFRDILEDAVRLRLRADVPVGSCLSGGLDSSSIVRLVYELLQKQGSGTIQKTFSASSHDPRWSEKRYSDLVIEETPIDGHYVYPDCAGLCDVLDRLIWHQDEPFGSTSIYAQWCVFQSAREQGMKVMLDGQGADEILFGYTDFVYAVGSELLLRCSFRRLYEEINVAAGKLHIPRLQIIGQIGYYAIPERLRFWIHGMVLTKKYIPAWLNREFTKTVSIHDSASYIPVASDPVTLSRNILSTTSLPMLLHFEDRNSMAHSIESRVPFTDYRIVEMALSLPSPMKWHQGISKVILRESMKGILPEIIRTRQDKMGFVTPEEIWITRDNPDMFRDMLASAVCDSSGIVNRRIIDAFDQVVQKRKPFNHSFWRIIVFGRWMKLFHAQYEAR